MLNAFLNHKIYIQVQPDTPLEDLQRLEDVTGKMWSSGEHLVDFVPTRKFGGPSYYCCKEDGIYFTPIEPFAPWLTVGFFLSLMTETRTVSTFLDQMTEIDISEKDLMDLLE